MVDAGRTLLTPLKPRHLAKTLEWINDKETARLLDRAPGVSADEHAGWYRRVVRDRTQVIFAIETRPGHEHVGNCGLREVDRRSRKAKLWIYLGKEFVGKGYGGEATGLLLKYGFGRLKLNRVYLYALGSNTRAIRMYERLGFRVEGRFREDLFTGGRYEDSVWMGLLKKDFQRHPPP